MKSIIVSIQCIIVKLFGVVDIAQTYAIDDYVFVFETFNEYGYFEALILDNSEVSAVITYNENGVTVTPLTLEFRGVNEHALYQQIAATVDFCVTRQTYFDKYVA